MIGFIKKHLLYKDCVLPMRCPLGFSIEYLFPNHIKVVSPPECGPVPPEPASVPATRLATYAALLISVGETRT